MMMTITEPAIVFTRLIAIKSEFIPDNFIIPLKMDIKGVNNR
jgi:hypothetical protein